MRCAGCGFEWGSVRQDDLVPSLHQLASGYVDHLHAHPEAALRRRPSPEVWSAVEYSCHVRDVMIVIRERVLLVLREPGTPGFPPMGGDERAVHARYGEQPVAEVARQLVEATAMLTFVFEGLGEGQWARTCIYAYPAPAERTLAWVAQQAVHEAEHHLADLVASVPAS